MEGSGMETNSQQVRKRKVESKSITIPWAIHEIEDEKAPERKIAKLVKSAKGQPTKLEKQMAPAVVCRKEKAANQHAFHIMYQLRHPSILCMRGLNEKTDDDGYLTAYVEPTTGLLSSICRLADCADTYKQIPSPTFQTTVRQMAVAIDFLKENGYYHGILSWATTLYVNPCVVKLAGFATEDR